MSVPPIWQVYEMPPRWYEENWPNTNRINTADLIPEQGTGMWFRYPDTGERVHLIDLLPCADGWTPQSLRDGRRVQGPLSEGDDVAAIAWKALSALSARTGQARKAAGKGRASKWQHLRERVEKDAIKLWKKNRALAASDSATTTALLRLWEEKGIDPLPSRDSVKAWIPAIQYPEMQKVER